MTDELRAKFERVFSDCNLRRLNLRSDCYEDARVALLWEGFQLGHDSRDTEVAELRANDNAISLQVAYESGRASRDAEVEALKRDAERYQLLRSGKSDIPLPLGAEALDIYLDRRLAAMAKESIHD